MKSKISVVLVMAAILCVFPLRSEALFKIDGYLGIAEEPNIVTLTGVKSFPYNLTFFGFVNFITGEGKQEDENDFTTYYGEANLTMDIWKGWGVITELDDGSEVDSLIRCGVSYRPPSLKDWRFQLRLFPYRSDNRGGQISFSFHKDVSKRFFIEGWLDYFNFWYGDSSQPDTTYMAEPQVGVKIIKNLCAVVEYCINNFMKGRHKTDDAWGIGLEYQF